MPHVRIVTDSSCDIPATWVDQLGIHVVPVYVNFGLESFKDTRDELPRAEFYRRLEASDTRPKTSAPPPGEIAASLSDALSRADHLIALTAPARLSGIHNSFRIAVEQLGPERITLVDSEMVSMGLGWQAVVAAELAQQEVQPAAICTAIDEVRARIRVWAAMNTLEYLRRSGRVSWAAAMVGELFNIKPIVEMRASQVSSVARTRTSQRAFDHLVALAQKAAPLQHLAVMHTNHLAGAHQLVETLHNVHPDSEIAVVEATPALGVHVGPQALGIALIRSHL